MYIFLVLGHWHGQIQSWQFKHLGHQGLGDRVGIESNTYM